MIMHEKDLQGYLADRVQMFLAARDPSLADTLIQVRGPDSRSGNLTLVLDGKMWLHLNADLTERCYIRPGAHYAGDYIDLMLERVDLEWLRGRIYARLEAANAEYEEILSIQDMLK
jgi:hypothetical protein